MPPIPTPFVAVDTALFSIQNDILHILLIQIASGFYKDAWALPGGLVHIEESLDEAAARVLFEKAHVKDIYLEQLHAFGDVNRDPRSRTISVAYYALINKTLTEGLRQAEYYKDTKWFPITMIPTKLAFDHRNIISFAYETLQDSVMYPKKMASLMPKRFTLGQLQKLNETILGHPIDKRNFRKKIAALEMVQKTTSKEEGLAHRPAWLYEFKKQTQ